MRMRLVPGILASLFAAVSCLAQSPATRRAPFTLDKEITLIDSPLNPDGTPNYLAAINALVSRGITADNNAAIPLIRAGAGEVSLRPLLPAICEGLNIPAPVRGEGLLQTFYLYATEKHGLDPSSPQTTKFLRQEEQSRAKPWTAKEFPEVAQWLDTRKPAFELIDDALTRPRFYIPLVSRKSPPTCSDWPPSLDFITEAAHLLQSRAMLFAGSGDLTAAMADVGRVRALDRLLLQGHSSLNQFYSNLMETDALKAYQSILTSRQLTADQLQQFAAQVSSFDPLPFADDIMNTAEEYMMLDVIMQCIRGDARELMLLQASVTNRAGPIDLGDFARANWDVLLKEFHESYADALYDDANPSFLQRRAAYDQQIKKAIAEQAPGMTLLGPIEQPSGIGAVEAFLKMRPGESREDFSRRLGRWLGNNNPATMRFLDNYAQTCSALRALTLLGIALARYQIVHQQYPASLDPLELASVPLDPFSGKSFGYRQEGAGYVVYSIGPNLKDDQASGDDIVFKMDH